MEVRASHSSCRSDEPDLLSSLYGIAYRHKCLAEVEVSSNDSSAVIDVNDIAGQEKVVDERDDTAVRRIHRLADGAPKIDAEVAAGHVAVEQASASKLTCDYRRAWAKE